MSKAGVRGLLGHRGKACGQGDMWAKVSSWLQRHSARMKNDPEYRATVEAFLRQLCELPDEAGRAGRVLAAAHGVVLAGP